MANIIYPTILEDIDINFDDLEIRNKINHLKDIYKKIPKTKCIKCPEKTGVEADCCKVFNPPIFLIEFLYIAKEIIKKDKKIQKELLIECLKSYLSTDIIQKCVLLNEKNMCLFYKNRPFACRMFGQYTKEEWKRRQKAIKDIKKEEDKIPFYNQCNGVIIDDKKTKILSTQKTDNLFKQIYSIDISLFEKQENGKRIVMNNTTYLPFEAHFLTYMLGLDFLYQITNIKITVIESKEKLNKQEINKEEHKQNLKKLKDFIEEAEKEIRRI